MERILFVCTGNIDRSPTAEGLLAGREGYEARSAGTMIGARRRVSEEDIDWADRIFVMEENHRRRLLEISPESGDKITVLGIPDIYRKGDPGLIKALREKLSQHGINL